jgi:pimeloyl-ACP methyl ester carboxylesterase
LLFNREACPARALDIQWGNVERPTHWNTSWDCFAAEAAAAWRLTVEAYLPDRARLHPPSGVFRETVPDVQHRAAHQDRGHQQWGHDADVVPLQLHQAEQSADAPALQCDGRVQQDDEPETRAPTLVIVGGQDSSNSQEIVNLLEMGIPNARKVVLPGAYHMVNMEQPGDFNRVVLDFLSQV